METINIGPRTRQDLPVEEYHDALETARAIKVCKRVKVTDLNSFIEACKASSSAERIGGILLDMTTKSMISQVWDYMQKHEKAEILTEKLSTRFSTVSSKYKMKTAIIDLVDRFWKLTRPAA